MIGRLALPVHAAASRTRAITSSRGTAAAIFARGRTLARSRVTKETSASGSAPGDSSAATALPRPLSISRRAGLNFGTLAESSEVVSDRFEATRTNGRTRTISRSPARVVVEMRITWRAALVSPVGGSLSVLRVTCGDALVAGQRAAQRRLDPLGQGGEIGFAVERDIDRAAHQRGAAKPGQDRAGKPLDGDAAAIDEAGGRAIDKQWRLIAEIDRL